MDNNEQAGLLDSAQDKRKFWRVTDFDEEYKREAETRTVRYWASNVCRKFWSKQLNIHNHFPFIKVLKRYKMREDFANDAIAGMTVGIMQIPQGMAYALLATLPPIVGLYMSFFAPLIYFFIGSSRHASLGVIAVVSLMVGSVLDTRLGDSSVVSSGQTTTTNTSDTTAITNVTAAPYNVSTVATSWNGMDDITIQKVQLAAALSFVSGFIMIFLGKLNMGLVARYMSEPMVCGFTSGVAIHVATTQAKHILGVRIGRFNGVFKVIKTWVSLFSNILTINWVAVIISVLCIISLYLVKIHINKRYKDKLKIPVPIEIIVVALATLASHFGMFKSNYNVNILEEIPAGIPAPSIPDVTLVGENFKDAFIIGIVAFTQSVSMAKILARKNNYQINPNQEMVAYGAGSVLCSIFSGYIPAASVARSMVQDGAGGHTQLIRYSRACSDYHDFLQRCVVLTERLLKQGYVRPRLVKAFKKFYGRHHELVASIFGCVVVLVVIVAIGPLFYSLPKCVLSAVILVNLRGMFLQFLELPSWWRKSRYDFMIWIVTFLSTVILDADFGIAVGIIFSVLTVSIRTQRPEYFRGVFVGEPKLIKSHGMYNESEEPPLVRIIRFQSPLYFANGELFIKAVRKISGINPEVVRKQRKRAAQSETERKTSKNEDKNSSEKIERVKNNDTNVACIVIDFQGVSFVDVVGVKALKQVFADYNSIGIDVYIAACSDGVLDTLRATEFYEEKIDYIVIDVASAIRCSKDKRPDIY